MFKGFKQGDRVVLGDNTYYVDKWKSGSLGTVKRVDEYGVHVMADGADYDLTFGEDQLTLIKEGAMDCKVSKDKVLEAAKTSPEAKAALKKLFPDMFEDKRVKFKPHFVWSDPYIWVKDGPASAFPVGGLRADGEWHMDEGYKVESEKIIETGHLSDTWHFYKKA